ncbi:MAG: hypothetical protein AAF621_00480 [Pseudomonadota bacterium]
MPAPDWEDLTAFFNADEFAIDIIVKLPDGDVTLKGIFDDAFFLAEIGEADLSDTQPRITLPTKDAEIISRKDQIVVHNTEYFVLENKPDGTGISIVTLGTHYDL